MNHYVYEITNLINGKKYIGKRSCHCPIEKDKYMGSGFLLNKAKSKYGVTNFKKGILEICKNEEDAFIREEYYGKLYNVVNSSMYYNIAECGGGGRRPFAGKTELELYMIRRRIIEKNKGRTATEETRKKLSIANSGMNNSMYGKTHLPEVKRYLSEIAKERFKDKTKHPTYGKKWEVGTHPMCGRKHTELAKQKIRVSREGVYCGENHPMYGKKHAEESKSKNRNSQLRDKGWKAKKIICLNNNEIFLCVKSAKDMYGIDDSCISKVCKGKRKSAGKINDKPAKWMYYEDYLKLQEN